MERMPGGWVLDPADPRAPTEEQWAAMSDAERDRVVAMLPSEFEVDFLPPPEGDPHWLATASARTTLDSFFRSQGRKVYISANIAVYYPGKRVIAPDVIAVLDVEPRERNSWVVAREGKGIDLAIEIHVAGERKKDVQRNVERYASLGIQEYFVFDRGRLGLRGFRLGEGGKYVPIVPQAGRYASGVLGLELAVEGTGLRFSLGTAALLGTDELLAKAQAAVDGVTTLKEEARAAEERIAELERQLREAQEEIAQLRGRGGEGDA